MQKWSEIELYVKKYSARHKAGLDGVQEEYSLPKCYFRNEW